jgi:hypothetical protein
VIDFYEVIAKTINEDGSSSSFTLAARGCPFCNSPPSLDGYLTSKKWFIECSDVKGDCLQPLTGSFSDPQRAAAQWNRRPMNG